MTSRSPSHPSPWYRQPLVWLVIGIPLSSVVMGIAMLTLSITTYDGLVTDDYYKQGLQINRSLERDEAARRHALSSEVLIGAAGGVIQVSLAGEASFQAPEVVDLRLFHATRAGLDRHIVLRRVSAGRYLSARPELAPGKWHLQLAADDWRLRGELQGGDGDRRLMLGRAEGGGR